jgi:hypothetical protein
LPTVRRWHNETGAGLSVWATSADYSHPVAAPAEEVAARLGVDLEQVLGCGVDPYLAADGRRLWSINLVAVALGLRRSRLAKQRHRDKRSPEAMARRRSQQRQRRARLEGEEAG